MPREFSRSQRMAEQLRRELAEIVRDEIKDPRLGFVSFTEVRMSRDLSHAVIYCSILNTGKNAGLDKHGQDSQKQQNESVEILNRAVGFIRKEIARRIQARIVPTLKFTVDDSVIRGEAMDDLINKAIQQDNRHDQINDKAHSNIELIDKEQSNKQQSNKQQSNKQQSNKTDESE